MATSKVAITLDTKTLRKVDQLVKSGSFINRSRAIQQALEEKVIRLEKTRLARECAKLDAKEEKALADEGISKEVDQWPEY